NRAARDGFEVHLSTAAYCGAAVQRSAAEAHQVKRAPAEEAAAFPHVAERIPARRAPFLASLDVDRIDARRDREGAVLRIVLMPLERGFDVAGGELSIAADKDRSSTGNRDLQSLERVAFLDRADLEPRPVILTPRPQDEGDGRALLDDARGLVGLAAFPADPDAERRDDQRCKRDQLSDIDPASALALRFALAHRPPASSKRRGAASSQLAAIRSPTWSQSTLLPA